ncbi:hypothetical protein JFN93_04925 [Geomonas sp. Red875]|uniref:Uncharacterized protein n=2 Tax=Geomesophilobacter sediminis TaxID=2798584 RepID=A0A8J7LUR9_9BACT|nr:hypothetical protein [Geomesophilobacter sediminis]
MLEFAALTGLEPAGEVRRYLWTDAFAVCNFLELFRVTANPFFLEEALRLVDQVHQTLGRHRDDDTRTGWISGLKDEEAERHPTRGGLRIGKELSERRGDERPDERKEWDRDGQYYHYLTKWMHALRRVAAATGDERYTRWGVELAETVHARFCYDPEWGGARRIYWKMSIDLSRPLVPSMGMHDPLDGLVSYCELQEAARSYGLDLLKPEAAELVAICRGQRWETDDPLGIGGLLWDAGRIIQLMIKGAFPEPGFLDRVLQAAIAGLEMFEEAGMLRHPAVFRLPFRELGLGIGLKGLPALLDRTAEHPDLFDRNGLVAARLNALLGFLPMAERIDDFWMDGTNSRARTWSDHREINMVMLATSLAPETFLLV